MDDLRIIKCKKCGYPGLALRVLKDANINEHEWNIYCSNILCNNKLTSFNSREEAIQNWNGLNAE